MQRCLFHQGKDRWMQERELYQRVALGVAPWTLGEVRVDVLEQRFEVQVASDDAMPQRCPDCNGMFLVCGHGDEQTWRQPDIESWQILLIGRVPLVDCPEHGVVRVSPPWADWYTRGLDHSLLGPWSLQQLKVLLDAEHISPSTLLKRGCSDKWVITGTVSALFVKQDVAAEPALSADELEAVDWAIENEPIFFLPYESASSDGIESTGDVVEREQDCQFDGRPEGETEDQPIRDRSALRPHLTGFIPAIPEVISRPPERELVLEALPEPKDEPALEPEPVLRLVEDSNRDANREPPKKAKPSPPVSPRQPEKEAAPRRPPKSLQRLRKPPEPSPSEWGMAIGQAVAMKSKEKVVRKKPEEDAVAEEVKLAPRREKLVTRRGFQQGYGLLTAAYLINSCLMSVLFPAVCIIFFSRLFLLSTSVFAPFEGGNDLKENQLVSCGLAALFLLVLVAFPIWHLIANDGVRWHYIPSALIGMTAGFALSPDYIDELFVAVQCCEIGFGIAVAALTVYTLSVVPARSRMSPPIIVAGVLTAMSVLVLFGVRSSSMLTIQADTIPPKFYGGLPDAALYIFALYGTLVSIPVAFLFELYRHTNFATRQFLNRSAAMLGLYLVVGFGGVEIFVRGAGVDFYDVPLALLPLGCINALVAVIPSTLLLADPQFTVSKE